MKLRAPIVLLALMAACSPQSPLTGGQNANDQSIVSSISGIDEKLQTSQTLEYILKCQSEKNKTAELTPADRVASVIVKPSEAAAHPGFVSFKLDKPVATGDYCAIDVKGNGNYGAAHYVFTPGYENWFYASTKAQVNEKRELQVTIYQTYKDPQAGTRDILASVSFPAINERTGTWKAFLECAGGKTFQSRQDFTIKGEQSADVALFTSTDNIPAQGLSCSKLVVADAASKEEKFVAYVDVLVKNDSQPVKFAATLNLKQDVLKAVVKKADDQCPDFDVKTRQCPPDYSAVGQPAVDAAPALTADEIIMVCNNPDMKDRPFYDEDVTFFLDKTGGYKVAYKDQSALVVATPALNTDSSTPEDVKFNSAAPYGGSEFYVHIQGAAGQQPTLRLAAKAGNDPWIENFWVSKTCTVRNAAALDELRKSMTP